MILKCITLLSTLNLIKTLRFETEFIKENIEQGKKKYQEYKEASRSEKTGSCWGSAILDLEESCAELNEESTARLAYSFLTCHLQQHKRKIHICEDDASIESCTETLTDTMFGIYTSFVMHTHNMCFYLQSANWQNKLDRTVDRLQDNSEDVAQKLEIQAHKQENLLIGMHAMSDMNSDILTKTEKLQTFIGRIFSLVEKIGYLQQTFHEHFATYEMILFYAGSVIVTFISTSFPGVSRARPSIMCLTAIALAIEQAVVQYGFIVQDDEIAKYKAKRYIRRLWLGICVVKWLKTLYSSGNPDGISQQILNQTRDTTMLLKDLRSQIAPLTSAVNKTLWFSDDDTLTSDHGTQTDDELSPLIIKPRRYTRKKSPEQKPRSTRRPVDSPSRNGTGRYNLRPITPARNTAPLAPITWPGFSSDEGDEEYIPGLDISQI